MPSVPCYRSFTQSERYKFTGGLPYYNSTIGHARLNPLNSRSCDFIPNQRGKLSTEWCPYEKVRPRPPLIIQCEQKYYSHLGMLPDYGGHVPGLSLRHGKTYGNDTRDAKRALKADFRE